MKFSIVFLAVLPAFFSAIDANLGPSHPIHSAPKPVVHHSAPKPVVHHTAPKPAPKPVVHHQPTVPKLPKKVPIPQPRPKIPTKPKTVTKPKVPSHPVTKPKVPTHQAIKPKVPTHQATKPKVPTHPVTKPKVPTHPAAKPKVPTHPATKPKVPTHPAKNPKTPTHPAKNPKTPTHPNTNPKTPVKPPVKTPPKTQPNPQTQPKVTTKGHDAIADHARSMIGTPYSWGGGSLKGKSYGVERGAKTLGFDCSGLARYSVYQATGKTIARTAAAQFADKQCQHVPFAQRRAGDLVFFNDGGRIHHVAIVSGDGSKMIHAPQTGDHVKESPIRMKGHMSEVARC